VITKNTATVNKPVFSRFKRINPPNGNTPNPAEKTSETLTDGSTEVVNTGCGLGTKTCCKTCFSTKKQPVTRFPNINRNKNYQQDQPDI